jgi:NADPH:quinone reductase-like Zn-dependent oxidoreductase
MNKEVEQKLIDATRELFYEKGFSGADNTVDYQNEKFTEKAERYNIIFDVVSNSSFHAIKPILAPNGIYIDTKMSSSLL